MAEHTLTHEFLVEPKHTANALGNPGVEVLGTPFLLLFMELASQYLIEKMEGEGTSSVGISADFQHCSATTVGHTVTVTTTLIEQDRKRYKFAVKAVDEFGVVGHGEHERFRVDNLPEFLEKATKQRS